MKTIFFLFLGIGATVFTNAHSQLFVPSAPESAPKSATGKAMLDLAHALKNDAYIKTAAKDKSALFTKLSDMTNSSEAGAALVSLSKLIKPAKFRSSFNAGTFAKTAASVTTFKQANALLLQLESGLNPGAFNSIWKMQRAGWLNEVK